MEKYYVAIFDTDWNGESHSRGDIVTAAPGEGPSSGAWANFQPVKGLCGQPELASIDDSGSGNLTFHYTVGTQGKGLKGFCIKARIGMPQAHAVIEPARSPRDPPPSVPKSKEPVLKFGASLAATSGRSFVGFVKPSRFQGAPIKKSTIYDNPLTWGLED